MYRRKRASGTAFESGTASARGDRVREPTFRGSDGGGSGRFAVARLINDLRRVGAMKPVPEKRGWGREAVVFLLSRRGRCLGTVPRLIDRWRFSDLSVGRRRISPPICLPARQPVAARCSRGNFGRPTIIFFSVWRASRSKSIGKLIVTFTRDRPQSRDFPFENVLLVNFLNEPSIRV